MESNKNEEQFCEGLFLKECQKCGCKRSCCDNGDVMEWIDEYFLFHDNIKEHLIKSGIKLIFEKDRVYFENCLEENKCKFLKYSLNKNIDPRPIDCKIYPYNFDWDNVDFDRKVVNLYCHDSQCLIIKDEKVNKELRKEVEIIIKRDFAKLFNNAQFKVKFFKNGEFE